MLKGSENENSKAANIMNLLNLSFRIASSILILHKKVPIENENNIRLTFPQEFMRSVPGPNDLNMITFPTNAAAPKQANENS